MLRTSVATGAGSALGVGAADRTVAVGGLGIAPVGAPTDALGLASPIGVVVARGAEASTGDFRGGTLLEGFLTGFDGFFVGFELDDAEPAGFEVDGVEPAGLEMMGSVA